MEYFKQNPLNEMKSLKFFGQLLSESISTAPKTQTQIAKELNVNNSVITKWQTGESFPNQERLPDIAKAYGIHLSKLFGAFLISREAREVEKKMRRDPKFTPKGAEKDGLSLLTRHSHGRKISPRKPH